MAHDPCVQASSSNLISHDRVMLRSESHTLTFESACGLAERALARYDARLVVLDLNIVRDASLAAFAHLVVLRRALRRSGRDLRLLNLSGRTEAVHRVNRLSEILPCE